MLEVRYYELPNVSFCCVFTDEQFKVGLDLDITLEIKPRSLSGVIMSVFSSRGDYLVIQMQDGNVRTIVYFEGRQIQILLVVCNCNMLIHVLSGYQ